MERGKCAVILPCLLAALMLTACGAQSERPVTPEPETLPEQAETIAEEPAIGERIEGFVETTIQEEIKNFAETTIREEIENIEESVVLDDTEYMEEAAIADEEKNSKEMIVPEETEEVKEDFVRDGSVISKEESDSETVVDEVDSSNMDIENIYNSNRERLRIRILISENMVRKLSDLKESR